MSINTAVHELATDEDVQVIDVSPELARYWLRHNTANRKLKPSQIDAYAQDMSAGRWRFNGEAIKFSGPVHSKLKLEDGQNRLNAVIRAAVTVRMLVVFNLEVGVQGTMDSGSKRTTADNLAIAGTKNAATVAAAAALAIRFNDGHMNGYGSTVSNARALEWIDLNPRIHVSAHVASQYATRADVPKSIVAYAHFLLSRVDNDGATALWRDMAEKVGLPAGDPVLALSNRFAQARRDKERVAPGTAIAAIIRTWNARRSGLTLKTVQFTAPGDSFPRIK